MSKYGCATWSFERSTTISETVVLSVNEAHIISIPNHLLTFHVNVLIVPGEATSIDFPSQLDPSRLLQTDF